MDQYLGSPHLATYLHPGPSGPFLELKSEPTRPPSPITSALLQHNPSLIDLCTFNSLYKRLADNPSAPNTSPFKPFLTPSDLYFCIPSNAHANISAETPVEPIDKANLAADTSVSPISSAGECSPNVSSCTSTPYSSPKVTHLLQQNAPLDPSGNQPQRKDSTMKSEAMPLDIIIKQAHYKAVQEACIRHPHISPILHRLLASPNKSPETSNGELTDNHHGKNLAYHARISSLGAPDPKMLPVFPTTNNFHENGIDTHTSQYDPSIQPMALLSLDTNGSPSADDTQTHNSSSSSSSTYSSSSSMSANKRPLEDALLAEQARIKRRQTVSEPIIDTQQHYCISYPDNVPRCVDCQTANPSDFAAHLAGCRFQHCRTLKYYGDNDYEANAFTTAADAKPQDIEPLCVPNSSGQPGLSVADATYIITRIAKVFTLMFLYEQNERTPHQHKMIIWKKYMAGWREVCDECSTTLFNYHYMCQRCGCMACIECYNQFSQLTIERRKKLQFICAHDDSFVLSEFIPWEIIVKLRNNLTDELSRLKIDYSAKLYSSTRAETLSMFIKTLKMKRSLDSRDARKIWTAADCNDDPNIEFYCNGRLPVFSEWTSENAKQFFRKVWATSCPILVRQVHRNLSKTLWQPEAFKEHMIDHRETPALWDCETQTPILTDETILTRFWDGFERLNIRLRDEAHHDRPRILKLKDWPTKKDFASVFPSLLHDLMDNIPFSDYTRRSYVYNGETHHGGAMNIVERLPSCLVKPDLGPKLYIAYSQLTSQATKKAGTTNLHIDVSDAVNVLVYVGIGGQGDDGADKEEEIRQVEAEVLDSNIDEVQLQRLRNGERPGALWHLFRSDDAKKIREYIGRAQRRAPGSDSIHDQTAYLEKDDLDKLRDWSKVESYPILQFLGDAVFIPSGAPHQVKNLHSCIKIAEDFVSPENLDRCLITTNEFRTLSKTHTNHADILQAKNILHYTTRDALHALIEASKAEVPSSSVHS